MQFSLPSFLLVLVLLSTPQQIFSQEELSRVISTSASDVHFWSHAAGKVAVEIIYNDRHSMLQSYIKSPSQSKRTTVLIIDGYQSGTAATSPMLTQLAKAYRTTPGYNVITVDWSTLSGTGNPDNEATFIAAVANVKNVVGQRVADFMDTLFEFKGIPLYKIHIVGFDLGAYVAGVAGRKAAAYNHGFSRVQRIAGLDPSVRRHEVATAAIALVKTDADFVDVYHTDIYGLGTVDDNGHVNIYVNGGGELNWMPGCESDTCNHNYAWKFFLAAFKTTYQACHCYQDGGATDCRCYSGCGFTMCGLVVGPKISLGATAGRYHVKAGELP